MKYNRRTFLKTTSLTAAAFAMSTGTCTVAGAAKAAKGKGRREKVSTVCGLCRARCPMVAQVQGKNVRLYGNPFFAPTSGKLCARGLAAGQILTDPDRLKFPMKRIGSRGSGKWRRISWKEANAEIRDQLKKALLEYGPDSLALLCGGPSSHYIRTLISELGGHVYDSSRSHNDHIRALGYGPITGITPDPLSLPAAEQVDCLVLIGSHVGENVQVQQVRGISAMLDRGSKLIVADPRLSTMAAKADFHLAIRPGTDTALLLGWIHFLFSNDLLDLQRLQESCLGLDELREHVYGYTLERVAEITDLPQDLISATGWLLGSQSGRSLVLPGNHLSWYGNDVGRVQAQAMLSVLLGSPAMGGTPFDFSKGPMPMSFSELVIAMESSVKVLGMWGQNPLQAEVSPYRTIAALNKIPFIFGTDVLPSEAMLYADIILPEASFLERMDVLESYQSADQSLVSCRFPVLPAMHECRDPYKIVTSLAEGLGQGSLFPEKTVASHLETQLGQLGSSLAALRQAGGIVGYQVDGGQKNSVEIGSDELVGQPLTDVSHLNYSTPSGKIELLSSWNQEYGLPFFPHFMPPQSVPSGFVRLLYGRSPVYTQTRTAGDPWLHHEISENVLWLSENSAASFGVKNNQRVRLENQDGIRAITTVAVKVTPGIRDDCCYLVHGFGNRSPLIRDAFLRGVSDTSLMTRGTVDTISGVRGMRDNFVRIIKG